MLFNSFEYIIFFPIVVILYFVVPFRFRWALLLAASCYFYMSLIPYYIIFVAVVVINDYTVALLIENFPQKKKYFAWQSFGVSLGILFFFKYFNFSVEGLSTILNLANVNVSLPALKILLPVGLSFYTFKSIGYVIEVYRGETKAERHIGKYALFVLFFPELLAGPIDRGSTLLPQFNVKHEFDYKRITDGLKLIAWGLFKKVVIADKIALIVNHVYGNLGNFKGIPLIITSALYYFQIYFDFSGYTDMAIGSGKILGFDLPENFNLPLLSQSITEFWRRWHISLSTWLRDYLYTPLAIETRGWGTKSVVFSLFVTFVIAGIWHGAGLTFVIFGALHGAGLVYEFLTRKFRKRLAKSLPAVIYDKVCNIIAFSYVSFAFIFFRSENISQAELYIKNLFSGLNFQAGGYGLGIGEFGFLLILVLIMFAMLAEILTYSKGGLVKMVSSKPLIVRWSLYYVLVLLILLFGEFGEANFVYFKF